ncbi:MAG: cytochrome C [Methylomonas sp.]
MTLAQSVSALPSFTRQTGEACTYCHTQAFGPNLNTYGREFKVHGYIEGSNDSQLSRISAMAEGSVTNLKRDDPSLGNNNAVLDQASVFYGGRIWQNMGAFIQATYNGVANKFVIDTSADIRIADEEEFFDQEFEYGVSFNNNPTNQDLWNTTPAWGFPYASSQVSNTPSAKPILSSLGGQVGGATLYNMFADILYLEAGAYTSLARYAQKGMGQWDTLHPNYSANSGSVKINGGAPYWRIALQNEWVGHYVSLGHFGFQASVQPDVTVPGYDKYTDLGTDLTYQYLGDPKHIYELKGSYIREHQQLNATFNSNGAAQPNQQLGFLAVNGMYTYDQTYSAVFGFNHIYGNADAIIYQNNTINKPNSEYFTFELDYIPFGKTAGSGLSSYMNLKFAAQYVAYTMFNGSMKNYDGAGHNAGDNNTLYFNGWLSF